MPNNVQKNKSLSDNTEAALALQGVSWILRKTLTKASISLRISQYNDDNGTHHFDTEQKILGRVENYNTTLNSPADKVSHPLLGNISIAPLWKPITSIEEGYLTEGWEEGTEDVVEVDLVNDEAGWVSKQVLGIEVLNGERRHSRRTVVTKGQEVVESRLVYDWIGPI